MESQSLVVAISKLAVVGEQAGFTLEEMIELLNGGLSIGDAFGVDLMASGRKKSTSPTHSLLKLGSLMASLAAS